MLWFVGKLLIVLQTFLRIGEVFLKRVLGVVLREGGQTVAVKELEVIEVRAVGERVLSEDNVMFTLGCLVQERGNETTGIGATNVNHPRPQRAKHGLAVVEQLLRRPIVRFASNAPRLLNRAPNLMQLPKKMSGEVSATQKCIVRGVNFLPLATLDGIEVALYFVWHVHMDVFGERKEEFPPALAKLAEFTGDDLLGSGRRWRR